MKSLLLIFSNPRYFGPAWVFASLNIWFGTWAVYIPAVKEKLGIDKADLGIAIFLSGPWGFLHCFHSPPRSSINWA